MRLFFLTMSALFIGCLFGLTPKAPGAEAPATSEDFLLELHLLEALPFQGDRRAAPLSL